METSSDGECVGADATTAEIVATARPGGASVPPLGQLALVFLFVACGRQTPPRGERTATDCERMVRHAIVATNTARAAAEVTAGVARRCLDIRALAWLNDIDDGTYSCLMNARTTAEGDACTYAAQPVSDWPPLIPATQCPAFSGAVEGSAAIRGRVTRDRLPLFGATLSPKPRSPWSSQQPSWAAEGVSEDDGTYVFEGLSPDVYNLVLYFGHYVEVHRCINAAGGTVQTVDIDLTGARLDYEDIVLD